MVGGAFIGIAQNSSALRYGVSAGTNAMIGMTCFALLQEALRAARGHHDVYNSALAGTMSAFDGVGVQSRHWHFRFWLPIVTFVAFLHQ